MEIGTIFSSMAEYDEAYKYVKANEDTEIIDLGSGKYQLAKIVIPEPTVAEQNEIIRQTRENAYRATSDYLKADYDEAVARGADNVEELKRLWLDSKDKIRENNPYIKE